MVGLSLRRRCGPIGVDIGSRSVKLLQLSADRSRIREAVRWDRPPAADDPEERDRSVVEVLRQASEGRDFRGHEAVLCLSADDLFVQNIRVAQAGGDRLHQIVHAEAANRLPFAADETDLHYLEADNVRQGDSLRREVILMACHRPVIQRIIGIAENAGLSPVAIDVEPVALLRCYSKQLRRDVDQQQRVMFVNVGASSTIVVIARGGDAMFVKNIDLGGRHLDEAVAGHLKMEFSESVALRRHNGDRRADQRDPEIARSVAESIRPVLDRLTNELAMCVRYYSVTFRGQPLSRVILGGGEAVETLAEWLTARLDVPCELGNPLRSYEKTELAGRVGQWDVAAGLALREVNRYARH